MKTIYDVAYFKSKFKAIPENKWLVAYQGEVDIYGTEPHCAIGWCKNNKGEYGNATIMTSNEAMALYKLFTKAGIKSKNIDYGGWIIAEINNGSHPSYNQSTAKKRILAALEDVEKLNLKSTDKQKTIVIEKIKYVSISEIIKKEISLIEN